MSVLLLGSIRRTYESSECRDVETALIICETTRGFEQAAPFQRPKCHCVHGPSCSPRLPATFCSRALCGGQLRMIKAIINFQGVGQVAHITSRNFRLQIVVVHVDLSYEEGRYTQECTFSFIFGFEAGVHIEET